MSKALDKARSAMKAMRDSGIKIERLDPIERAKRNPTSLKAAIKAKCWDCCGAGSDGVGETKESIRTCRCLSCPLHSHRPYKEAA